MSLLTIKQAKEMQKKVANQIKELLNDFQDTAGLAVRDVHLEIFENSSMDRKSSIRKIGDVRIETHLDYD